MNMPTWLVVILLIAAVLTVLAYFLYKKGQKMQAQQEENRRQMDAMAQTVSILVLDKKKMKMQDAHIPQQVIDGANRMTKMMKMPIVRAKVGPRVMDFLCDEKVFEAIPVKSECKVVISGLYITAIKSVRGGSIQAAPEKKGFFSRFKKK